MKERCPRCGIPVGEMPEDATADEMLCNRCEIECEFPECDRDKQDADGLYCEFHTLQRKRSLGEPVTEQELERAFYAD